VNKNKKAVWQGGGLTSSLQTRFIAPINKSLRNTANGFASLISSHTRMITWLRVVRFTARRRIPATHGTKHHVVIVTLNLTYGRIRNVVAIWHQKRKKAPRYA
jgi:hypothetical protein